MLLRRRALRLVQEVARQPVQWLRGKRNLNTEAPVSVLRALHHRYEIRRDTLLVGAPGPDRLFAALAFLEHYGLEFEYLALSRDTSEADLTQRREIVSGASIWVDSPVVRAAREGKVLILDGVEKAERNVLVVLNNLLENRALPLLSSASTLTAHPDFFLIALSTSPPYPGHPLDPPLRSRFASLSLPSPPQNTPLSYTLSSLHHSPPSPAALSFVSSTSLPVTQSLPLVWEPAHQAKLTATATLPTSPSSPKVDLYTMSQKGSAESIGAGSRKGKEVAIWTAMNELSEEGSARVGEVGEVELGVEVLRKRKGLAVVGNGRGNGKSRLVEQVLDAIGRSREDDVVWVSLISDFTARDLLMRRSTNSEGDTIWEQTAIVDAVEQGKVLVIDGIHRFPKDTLAAVFLPILSHNLLPLPNATTITPHKDFRVIFMGDSTPPPSSSKSSTTTTTPSVSPFEALHDDLLGLVPILQPPNPFQSLEASLESALPDAPASLISKTSSLLQSLLPLTSTLPTPPSLRLGIQAIRRVMEDGGGEERIGEVMYTSLLGPYLPQEHQQDLLLALSLPKDFVSSSLSSSSSSVVFKPYREEKTSTTHFSASLSVKTTTPANPDLVPSVPFLDTKAHAAVLEELARALLVRKERFVMLIGAQGTGKNRVCDRFLELTETEREYMQLNRDSTVSQLTTQTAMEDGKLVMRDSPLVIAAKHGRTLVIDEADKAPPEVLASLRSLLEGHLRLQDGRVLSLSSGSIHPNFRMILLANRPGFPFLGNDVFASIGDLLTVIPCDPLTPEEELAVLRSDGPSIPEEILGSIALSFDRLRDLHSASLPYPFSLRDAVGVTRLLEAFPEDGVANALSAALDYDATDRSLYDKTTSVFHSFGIPTTPLTSPPVIHLQPQSSTSSTTTIPSSTSPSPSHPVSTSSSAPLFSNPLPTASSSNFPVTDLRKSAFGETMARWRLFSPEERSRIQSGTRVVGVVGGGGVVGIVQVFPFMAHFFTDFDSPFSDTIPTIHSSLASISPKRNHTMVAMHTLDYMGAIQEAFPRIPSDSLFNRATSSPFSQPPSSISLSTSTPTPTLHVTYPNSPHTLGISASGEVYLSEEHEGEFTGGVVGGEGEGRKGAKGVGRVVVAPGVEGLTLEDGVVEWGDAERDGRLRIGKMGVGGGRAWSLVTELPNGSILPLPTDAAEAEEEAFSGKVGWDEGMESVLVGTGWKKEKEHVNRGVGVIVKEDSLGMVVEESGLVHLVQHGRIEEALRIFKALHPTPEAFSTSLPSLSSAPTSMSQTTRQGESGEGVGVEASPTASKAPADMKGPREGRIDPENAPHVGGNTWYGGTGGSDTAGMGGRGGPYRVDSGHKIAQVSDEAKAQVSEETIKRAKEIAAKAKEERLREIGMTRDGEREYTRMKSSVGEYVHDVRAAFATPPSRHTSEERVWVKRQTSGELDDARLVDGVLGDKHVYQKRASPTPSPFSPPPPPSASSPPMRLRLLVDCSASMMRFNSMDGRLDRLLEATTLVMEGLDGSDRVVFDIVGHSGDSAALPLTKAHSPPANDSERHRILQTMVAHSQFTFAGDHTLESLELSKEEIAAEEGEGVDLIVLITDANFRRYGILYSDVAQALKPKTDHMHVVAVMLGNEDHEAGQLQRHLPEDAAYVCQSTSDLPRILKSILTSKAFKPKPM